MRWEKKQIRTPNEGAVTIFDFSTPARRKRTNVREKSTRIRLISRRNTSPPHEFARKCAFTSSRSGLSERLYKIFPLVLRAFSPSFSRSVSLLPHRLRKLSFPREKNKKIAKLHAPLLEEPNMVRAFALVDVEHKKLMVLI